MKLSNFAIFLTLGLLCTVSAQSQKSGPLASARISAGRQVDENEAAPAADSAPAADPAPATEEPAAPAEAPAAPAAPAVADGECSDEELSFEMVTGFVYTAPSDMLDSQPGTLMLTDCIDTCRKNSSCKSINYETGLCVLFSSDADDGQGKN